MVGVLIATGRPTLSSEPETAEERIQEAYALFPELFSNAEYITEIELEFPNGLGMGIIDVEDEGWRRNDAPFTQLANQQKADEARVGLARMPTYGPLETDDQPTETINWLPGDQTVIRFQVQDSPEAVEFYIGGLIGSLDAYYVSFTPEGGIFYLIPREWLDIFLGLMFELEPEEAQATPSPAP
jgi:hypothetical protein